jgi:hypothetical protein
MDSIQQKVAVKSATGSERQWLSPTVCAGACYELARYLNVGALFGYRFSKYEGAPPAALSVNTQGFTVNASASYSYYNRNSKVADTAKVKKKIGKAQEKTLIPEDSLSLSIRDEIAAGDSVKPKRRNH